MATLSGISKHGPVHVQAVLGGLLGFDAIGAGDAAAVGSWHKIKFLVDTAVAVDTITTSVGDNLPARTYTAGEEVSGPFNGIDLSALLGSELLIAYRW